MVKWFENTPEESEENSLQCVKCEAIADADAEPVSGWQEGEFGPVCPQCSAETLADDQEAAEEDRDGTGEPWGALLRVAAAVQKRNMAYVDLDGTLAHFDGFKSYEHIGEPIPAMVEKVKAHLAAGGEVTIFTARLANHAEGIHPAKPPEQVAYIASLVQDWCEEVFGHRFPVTAIKGGWDRCYDDSIHQIIRNTGKTVQEHVTECLKKWEARAISAGKPSEAMRLAIEELELLFADRHYTTPMTKVVDTEPKG